MFEWDEKKNKANYEKHGISFDEAGEIFTGEEPFLTFPDTRKDYGESRYISIGVLSKNALLVVAHTHREGRIRIISARKANKRERRKYYAYLKETTKSD